MRRLTLPTLLVLVLASCSPADETAAETTTTGAEATTTEAPATTTTTVTTTTTTEPTTTMAAAAGGPDCLVGEWELDSEAFLEQLATAMAEESGGQDMTIDFAGGSYLVSMQENGQFLAEREDWSFEMGSPEGTFRVTIDGEDTGTWEADQSSLTVSNVETSSVLTTQAVVDGELVDLPQGTMPLTDTDAVGETSTYTCSGDTLTVESEDFTSQLNRVGG